MANSPRPENRHRMVRVEDELWDAAGRAAAEVGTTRSEVMRAALRTLVDDSWLRSTRVSTLTETEMQEIAEDRARHRLNGCKVYDGPHDRCKCPRGTPSGQVEA